MFKQILPEKINSSLLIFISVVVMVFSGISFESHAMYSHGVEQWINLTNQVFYGKNDFLFSYGPLYWLTGTTPTMYNAFAYFGTKTFLALEYGLFWSLLVYLLDRYNSILLFLIIYGIFIRSIFFQLAIFLLPIIFVYFLEYGAEKRRELSPRYWILIGLYIGFIFYVRYFYGMLSIVTIFSYLFT